MESANSYCQRALYTDMFNDILFYVYFHLIFHFCRLKMALYCTFVFEMLEGKNIDTNEL